MRKPIQLISSRPQDKIIPNFLSEIQAAKVRNFHQSMPEYNITPLVSLPHLAKQLGIAGIYIKDESKRFGLNAFKGLGASYAINKVLEQNTKPLPITFVTATDGNHGKAVAWASARAGCKSVVFMPHGSKECRVQAIANISGATVEVTPYNYDDTVRHAYKYAQEQNAYLVQDTAFEGYSDIPDYITQGYTTMAAEAIEQLQTIGIARPTHTFLQAGVGSMAAGVLGYLTCRYQGIPPITTIIEAASSACIYESAQKGSPVAIGGHPETIMAGLNCGEVNINIWPILRDFASFYAKCPDWVTTNAMYRLANPIAEDNRVISGESGAVGLGLLMSLCTMPEYNTFREQMNLNQDSVVLLFSTEGDTDPEHYNHIVNTKPENF